MANSKIVITFTREAVAGDVTTVKRRDILDPLNFAIQSESWISYRRPSNGYISAPTGSNGTIGANTAYLFAYYFNLDYNGYGIYAIQNPDQNNTNQVEILCTTAQFEFYDFVGGTLATAVITNHVLTTFTLVSATKQTSVASPEFKYGLRIVTTEPVVRYYVNQSLAYEGAFGTDFVIDLARGVPNDVRLQDANYENIVITPSLYLDFLSANNISIKVTQSITGATVTATVNYAQTLTLQYSLDGVTWQTSNVFTGQATGEYTMYVKDNYGSTKTKLYTVFTRGQREAYFFLSKASAIGFKKQVVWDNYTIFKNNENTLAFERDEAIKYCSSLLYQTLDKPRIQFKSNYSTNVIKLRKEDLSEVVVPLEKMSENLDKFMRLDATYYTYQVGKLGIFFNSGWTYTNAGVKIKEYALNGNLPDLAIIGGLISIDGLGAFEIKDVIYDDAINKKAIIVDYNFIGDYTNTIVEAVFDLLPFEVYEVDLDFNLYGEGTYDLLINLSDLYNEPSTYLSENISVQDIQSDTVAIMYFNRNNRDVFYKYGIKHFIRVPIISIKSAPKDSTDIIITDDSVAVKKSVINEAYDFTFDEVDEDLMFKIIVALSCDNVFIQDIGYAKDGSVSLDAEANTNLYRLKATMLKKGFNFTTASGSDISVDNIEELLGRPVISNEPFNLLKK